MQTTLYVWGIVRVRVGFVLRSTEIKPLYFDLFHSNHKHQRCGGFHPSSPAAPPPSISYYHSFTAVVYSFPKTSPAGETGKREQQQQKLVSSTYGNYSKPLHTTAVWRGFNARRFFRPLPRMLVCDSRSSRGSSSVVELVVVV